MTEQLQRRQVSPMQIIQHEHHRMVLGGGGKDPQDRAEQQVAGGLGISRPPSTLITQTSQARAKTAESTPPCAATASPRADQVGRVRQDG